MFWKVIGILVPVFLAVFVLVIGIHNPQHTTPPRLLPLSPEYLENKQKLALFTYHWIPSRETETQIKPPKAVIFFIHDFGGHSRRYKEFGHFLSSKGYYVHSLDLQGHGKSGWTLFPVFFL